PDGAAEIGLELCLTRSHPRTVAGDGVDLAVVREHPERLRETPVRHRVGRVALVEDRELALARLVPQVEVEVGEPRARHQPLVDDGLAGAGRDVHTHALALAGPSPSPLLPSASRPPRCARRARARTPSATAS